ncbi:MAG TPA: efflux RND transporter periplasmic adaptor subunit [Candidatus Binataceae bacterium]|nr:efflux RND transporter periplasmic adaptor subunit [Candidatus Binataceae bacterium]
MPTRPPVRVSVSLPVEREVIRWNQYSGYLSSPQTADVKARVSGLIVQAPFREGTLVHQGDLLFRIDPRPFQADLDNKQAAVAQAKAAVGYAKLQYQRYSALVNSHVVSAENYDNAKATYLQAQAALEAAQAALESSRLNLQWTEVRAPIAGRISRINVTVGNLVNGGSAQATTLTTIVSIDPIYCYLNVPEGDALRYQEIALEEKHANVAQAKEPCDLQLENESGFPHHGLIDFIDNQVDVSTGTVQLRCVLANPTGLLIPGLFALAHIPASGRYRALLIPDAAVNTDQNERYLLIVGRDNIVERRPVTLGALFGDLRAITQGLKPGERVIVEGMQFASAGSKVIPHQVPIPAQALALVEREARLPQTQFDPPVSRQSGALP